MNIISGISVGTGWLFLALAEGVFSWRLRLKTDAKFLSPYQRNFLESKTNEIAKKLGIKKDLKIIEVPRVGFGRAMGNTIFPGKAGIAIDPELFTPRRNDDIEFLLSREISHIKSNDPLTLYIIPALVTGISFFALSIFFPRLATRSLASNIPFAIGLVAHVIFVRWREKCADKQGFSVCSEQGKIGAIKFLKGFQEDAISARNDKTLSLMTRLWIRLIYSAEGELRFNIFEPSLKSRIQYLKSMN